MSKKKTTTYKVSTSLSQRERIRQYMEKLDDLKDASYHVEQIIEEVRKRNGTFDDLLEAIFEYEATCLEDRRVTTWGNRQHANFTLEGTTFDNFIFSTPKLKIDKTLLNELRSFRFIEEHKNVIIVGPVGVGKSHIACALGHEAIENGYETRCMRLENIVEEVNKTINSERDRDQKIKKLVNIKLLILDDIEDTEKLGDFSEAANDFLYTIMRKRYESNTSTIFTFNKSFGGWDKIFGGEDRAKKLIDRIIQRRHVLKIDGNSYREWLGSNKQNNGNGHIKLRGITVLSE
jgi:DNA replication protein DnaC